MKKKKPTKKQKEPAAGYQVKKKKKTSCWCPEDSSFAFWNFLYFFLIFLMQGLFESVDMKPMDMEDQLFKCTIHHHQVEFVQHMQDWFNI